MDTKELEKFCPWARIRLIDEVRQRCYAYGLDDAGREEFDRDATIVKGTVLSALERSQRSELYRRIEHDGYARFCEEMAYTWFTAQYPDVRCVRQRCNTLYGSARLSALWRAHAKFILRNLGVR